MHSAQKADLCPGWAEGEWIGESERGDGSSPGEIVLMFPSGHKQQLLCPDVFPAFPVLCTMTAKRTNRQYFGSKRKESWQGC